MSLHAVTTSRDLEILHWIGQWRAVTTDQIWREFKRRHGFSRKEVYDRRLLLMRRDWGLVESRRLLGDWPNLHWLTEAGMKAAGLEGSPPSAAVAELVHDLEVVELADHIRERQPEQVIVTEQEIRRTEPNPAAGPRAQLRSDIELGVDRATGGRGFPDLATIETASPGVERVWVHELERSRKAHRRLVSIMLSYSYAQHIHGVVYWAWPDLLASLQAAAHEANVTAQDSGVRPKVIVRPWEPSQSRP